MPFLNGVCVAYTLFVFQKEAILICEGPYFNQEDITWKRIV